MKLHPIFLIGLCSLVAVTGCGVAASSHAGNDRVYSVAAVRAKLAQDAKGWVGRTILVRGGLTTCMAIPSAGGGPCAALVPAPGRANGGDPATRSVIAPLPLKRAGLNPFLADAQRVPLLGRLVPAPQVLHWGAVATYRVQLRAMADSLCGTGVCFEAVLLDAAP